MFGFKGWKVALAAIAIAAATVGARAETLRFDFKKPADAKDWKALWGKWSVSKRGYVPQQEKKDGSSWATSLYDKQNFADVDITYTATPGIRRGLFTSAVWVRANYKNTKKTYDVRGYYFTTAFDKQKDTVAVNIYRFDEFKLSIDPKTSNDVLCYKEHAKVGINNYDIRVQAQGDSLKIFYGKDLLCSAKDKTYKTGKIGFSIANRKDMQGVTSIERVEVKTTSK